MARSNLPHPSGSGSDESQHMKLGKIVRPHGVRGELCMEIYTAYPERIPALETVYLNSERALAAPKAYTLQAARFHRGVVLLTLEGIEDRGQADSLRGQIVTVSLSEGAPLAEGEFYAYQLLGISVYTEAGEYLGKLTDIIETGANDVYLLKGSERGEILIPDTPEVIRQIDLNAQKMTINPIPGLLSD